MEVGCDRFEDLGKAFRLLPVVGLKTFGGLVETARSQQALAEEREEGGVFFVGRERLEQRDCAVSIALAQAGLGEKERAGAVCGSEPVGAFEIFDGLIERSAGLGQLAGANKTARRKIGVAETFG